LARGLTYKRKNICGPAANSTGRGDQNTVKLIKTFLIAGALAGLHAVSTAYGQQPGDRDAGQIDHELARAESEYDFPAEKPALDDYLAHAALFSPALKAAFHGWKAELAKVSIAKALPEPTFTYAYFVENVETRVGPQRHRFSVHQSFPWFGTLGKKGDMASEAANAAYQRYQAEKLSLFYRVRSAYYDYYYLGAQIEIARRNMELLSFWEEVARTRYSSAVQPHADLVKVQVELGTLEDRLRGLEQQLVPAAARLKAAVNLPDSVSPPVPDSIPARTPDLTAQALVEMARAHNPDLKAIDHVINSQRAAVSLAGRSSLPRFTIGADYIETGEASDPTMAGSGKDAWTVSVGISLPIWFGKNKAAKSEAVARLHEAEQLRESRRDELDARVELVRFFYEDAGRRLSLYRDGLVAKAEESMNVAFAAYRAGTASFLQVIDAQRVLLELRLQTQQAAVEHARRLAELEMLTGQDLHSAQEKNKE